MKNVWRFRGTVLSANGRKEKTKIPPRIVRTKRIDLFVVIGKSISFAKHASFFDCNKKV